MNALDEKAGPSAWTDISPEAMRFITQEGGRRGIISTDPMDYRAVAEALCLSCEDSLTISGAALLCRRPDRYIEGSYVRIGLFDSDGNPVKEDVVRGPLILQPANAVRVLFNQYVGSKIVYKNLYIDTASDYPEKAVEEAILNACVHRDLLQECPVEIRLRPGSLTVSNRGGLPQGWDAGTLLKEHGSRPRNVRIADTFRDLGLMSCWGTGIRRMVQGCASAGLPSPLFEAEDGGFSVTFRMSGPTAQPDVTETSPEASLEDRILDIIEKGDLRTGQEISEAVGVNRRQFTRIIADLMESGAVVREGNRRKGKWTVRRRSLRILDRLQKPVERML